MLEFFSFYITAFDSVHGIKAHKQRIDTAVSAVRFKSFICSTYYNFHVKYDLMHLVCNFATAVDPQKVLDQVIV